MQFSELIALSYQLLIALVIHVGLCIADDFLNFLYLSKQR